MLRHLGLLVGCFDWRRFLLRWRPSSVVPLRSTHHAPNCGGRRREASDNSPPAAAAEEQSWVILNRCGIRTDEDDDSSVAADDAKTVAYSRTSSGHHLRVSFRRAPPPASSFIYYDFPDTAPDEADDDGVDVRDDEDDDVEESEEEEEDDVDEWRISVVAAHQGSVLLKMSHRRCLPDFEDEHFLYRAGAAAAAAASPPSMSMLPDRDFLTKSEQVYVSNRVSPPIRPIVHSGTTSLLRRGDDDVLIVQLHLKYDRGLRQDLAEFCLLRHGAPRWELKEPVPILHDDEGGRGDAERRKRCGTDTIIPLGDRFLCWVEYEQGFLLCDMADELASPRVRYVPLPPGVCSEYEGDGDRSKHCKNMGAAGASALRFVSVDPHCCCGGAGRSTCLRSRHAFTINTWMMKVVDMDAPMVWEKDGEIDCEEIWALPGWYDDGEGQQLPRANLQCPVVSLENPSVVCFLVSNRGFVSSYEDRKEWMIQLNIKTKALLSAVQFTQDRWAACHHLPVKLQC